MTGDWGLGIGDWGSGPMPNPQSPNWFNICLTYSIVRIVNFQINYNLKLFKIIYFFKYFKKKYEQKRYDAINILRLEF